MKSSLPNSPIWLLAKLKPQSHQLAETNLSRQGYDLFCPKMIETLRQRNRLAKTLRPVFPGYIFIRYDPKINSSWSPINSTRGVSRLVAFNSQGPAFVPNDLIEALRVRFNADQQQSVRELYPGEKVRLVNCPFVGSIATIDTVPSKDRIWILLNILGKKNRVKVARSQIV